jgi:Flp pilus assembly protein TadG
MKRQRQLRTKSGLSITVLIAFIGIFIIGPLSMFIFELSRYNLADQQLKNCVDLAALTAACSTTGSNATNASTTQSTAMNQAYYMFTQNSIFNYPLTTTPAYTYGTGNATMNPASNQAQLYFQFLNPQTKLPVAYGSDLGKILRVTGAWGFVPITAQFTGLPLGPYVIVDQSDGGLPTLDVVLCLDLSASMDDFTNVSLVQRYQGPTGWNATTQTGGNAYALATGTPNGPQGALYNVLNCTNSTGCSINATWPIDYFAQGGSYPIGDAACTVGCYFAGRGNQTGQAAPYAQSAFGATNGYYSDMVVNLDGSTNMAYGVTVTNSNGSFTFPAYTAGDPTGKALGILVEASRGNLESTATAIAAHVPYGSWGITPKVGWFDAYYQTVMSAQTGFPVVSSTNPNSVIPLRHPIGDAIVAAENFFSVMNNDADVHFGLVCFGSNAGTSATAQMLNNDGSSKIYALTDYADNQLPSTYPPDGIICPNPMIALNPLPGPTYSNFSTAAPPPATSVNGAIFRGPNGASPWNTTMSGTDYNFSTVCAYGGTNIADALDMALSMELNPPAFPKDPSTTPGTSGVGGRAAQNLSRAGSTRAVVLFTDGLPTAGGDTSTSDPYAKNEANCAATAGIPIYTIGLCMVPSLQSSQTTVLGTTSSGIAGISGHGASFSQTTTAAGLNAVFQNVARQLVQLVQ